MAATGVAAAATMVVGDTTFDVLMARAAGAVPVGVSWGNHPAGRSSSPPVRFGCWTGSTSCTTCLPAGEDGG